MDLDNFTQADIALVTQARRAQKQQQQDEAATGLSTAPITNPEDIPDLDGINLADRRSKVPQETQQQTTPPLADSSGSLEEASQTQPEHQPDPDLRASTDHRDTSVTSTSASSTSSAEETQTPPDNTIITAPFTHTDLIREQKQDPALKQQRILCRQTLSSRRTFSMQWTWIPRTRETLTR